MVFQLLVFCGWVPLELPAMQLNRSPLPWDWQTPSPLDLRDEVYYFPANRHAGQRTTYLPLQRWDLIFTGNWRGGGDVWEEANVNRLIPGDFNHLLVYMGKDSRGLAYAAELMPASDQYPGTLVLTCLGSDFAIHRHHQRADLFDRQRLTHRWAKRFQDDERAQLLLVDSDLLARVHMDLVTGFPYQFEFSHSGNLLDRNVYLVDDGLENGASCSDYWTTLFEELAGICMKGVRMPAAEIMRYFRFDPQGRQAYAPPEFTPFDEPVLLRTLLNTFGFIAIDGSPHVFACDGSEESGLILPSLIFQSELLKEIEPLRMPFPLPWWTIGNERKD